MSSLARRSMLALSWLCACVGQQPPHPRRHRHARRVASQVLTDAGAAAGTDAGTDANTAAGASIVLDATADAPLAHRCALGASVTLPVVTARPHPIEALRLGASVDEARVSFCNFPLCSAVLLGADFTAGLRSLDLPVSTASCAPPTLVVPVGRADHTDLVTFGVSASRSPTAAWQFLLSTPPQRPPNPGLYVPSGGVAHRMRFLPRELRAVSRGELTVALSTGTELRCTDPCTCNSTSPEFNSAVRTVVFGPAGAASELLYRAPMRVTAAHRPDAPSVALGRTRGAAVFRSQRAINMVWLDARGRRVGELTRIAEGDIGAPTVAFHRETLLVVWASRQIPDGPYALRAFTWAPGEPTGFTVMLTDGTASAFAPALATEGDRTVLAWMEGDDRRGVIRVGATLGEVAHVTDDAVTLTLVDSDSRDPEIALTASRSWIAWTSYGPAPGAGAITAAELLCL